MAYVYKHIRLDTKQPFYVGIGNDEREGTYPRAYSTCRNSTWKEIVELTDYEVRIVKENLTWEKACKLEKKLISQYGRLDKETGLLCNRTDGGDGTVGYHHTQETKTKMSKKNKGQKRSQEFKKLMSELKKGKPSPRKGKPMSEEQKKKISETKKRNKKEISSSTREKLSQVRKGKKVSEETKQKMSRAKKGLPKSEEHRQKISASLKGKIRIKGYPNRS